MAITPASLFRLVPAIALAAALTGCGFRPLDAHAPGSEASAALAGIEVEPIPERIGQVMRSSIERRLNPTSVAAAKTSRLKVTYTSSSAARGIRNDDSAIRNDYTLNATFTLASVGTEDVPEKLLFSGTTTAITRHNNPEQLYAGYVSTREAQERAADMVAEDIARQIRLYFRNPAKYPPQQIKEEPAPVPHGRPTRP